MGVALTKRVKDGLILSGDGAGFLSIDFAVATGRVAGQVAAEAVQEGDVTEKGLAKCEKLYNEVQARKEWYTSQFHGLEEFFGLPEEEVERRFKDESEKYSWQLWPTALMCLMGGSRQGRCRLAARRGTT